MTYLIAAESEISLPVSIVAIAVAASLLIVLVMIVCRWSQDNRRHSAAIANRDRQIAALQEHVGRMQAASNDMGQRLNQLLQALDQLESQSTDGISRLRLDETGKLVEER